MLGQTEAKAIDPHILNRLKQAKRTHIPPPPVPPEAEKPTLKNDAPPPLVVRSAPPLAPPPSALVPPPARTASLPVPEGITPRRQPPVSTAPPSLETLTAAALASKGATQPEPATDGAPLMSDDEADFFSSYDSSFYQDDDSWGREEVRGRSTPNAVPDLDGIPAPLGIQADKQGETIRWCNQPDWAFDGRASDVPVGSYYDDWIWDALRPTASETSVELYVSATPLHGEEKESALKRKDGSEVKRVTKDRLPPTFSFNHHCLQAIPNSSSDRPPWGDAKRALLIPVTYQSEQHKENYYSPPYTEYTPKIASAQRMLNGEDATLHVIHGRCAISFNDGGEEHYSEYWVVLPKDDLKRLHLQRYQTEEDQVRFAQDMTANPTPRTYLRPNERFLGVWSGEGAKSAYNAAKSQLGAVMPSDWTHEEVQRLNQLHHGKAKRVQEQERLQREGSPIISPLQIAADRHEKAQQRHQSPPPPAPAP